MAEFHVKRITLPSGKVVELVYLQTGWVDVEDWGSMLVTFDDGSVAQITAADTVLGGIRNYLICFGANLPPNADHIGQAWQLFLTAPFNGDLASGKSKALPCIWWTGHAPSRI